MIRFFTDETIKELFKRDMDAYRRSIEQFDPVAARRQIKMGKKRFAQFMAGELDTKLTAFQLQRIKVFVQFNKSVKKTAKSGRLFRLLGNSTNSSRNHGSKRTGDRI